MRRLLKFILYLIVIFVIAVNALCVYNMLEKDNIINKILELYKRESSVLVKNEYYKNVDNNFVSITNDFSPHNKQELLNIYYTVFSSGMNEFTFFCSKEYKTCIDDVVSLTHDDTLLSNINNFIHVFNSYKSVKTSYTTGGEVTLSIERNYNIQLINSINVKIDELYPRLVKENKTVSENIKAVHDYIINNAKYDEAYLTDESKYMSNNAYGALVEGYAICSGYADAMSLFLERMDVINHKVSNDKHVWNMVYIDGKWLHLDLTWDDPIANNGRNYLRYDYFLINNEGLLKLDTTEHSFDAEIYKH